MHTLSIYLAGLFILIDEQNRCIHTVYISGVTYSLERAVIVLCACLPACLPVYAFHVHFLKQFFFSMEIDVLLWSWLSWMHRKSLWFAMLKNRRWKIKWKIYSYYIAKSINSHSLCVHGCRTREYMYLPLFLFDQINLFLISSRSRYSCLNSLLHFLTMSRSMVCSVSLVQFNSFGADVLLCFRIIQ